MFSILNLCARIEGTAEQRERLIALCMSFGRWTELLPEAEKHGIVPLVRRHLVTLEVELPDDFLRGLRFLCLRHQESNRLLLEVLQAVLSIFEEGGIPSLVLKGGALCRVLYPEIGLRPMRDLYLLLSREDVYFAHELLRREGFRVSNEPLQANYFHLPGLLLEHQGLPVCVELHHGLYPNLPPFYRQPVFDEVFRDALAFDVCGVTAYHLATEEMLWHLYQHGFRVPLTYESCRLIAAADIISLVEKQADTMDWGKVQGAYPQLYTALPLFHYLSPWSAGVRKYIPLFDKRPPRAVGVSFSGWPRFPLNELRKRRNILTIVRHTLLPGTWWLRIYYGVNSFHSLIWCLLVRHPRHIFLWVKIVIRLAFRYK